MIRRFAAVVALGLALAGVAFAGGNDRAAAEAALKDVAASPKKDVAGEMVARAKAALDRGAQLRSKGDEKHALLADAVAKTWADAARDAVKAATASDSAAKARNDANDAGLVADRERALLEEAVAQSGRLRAQVESAATKEKETPARTSAAAADGGAPKPKARSQAPAKLDGGAP